MKYVCMNYDTCDYYEENIEVKSDTPYFQTCPYCLGLIVLVSSTANIEELLSDGIIIELSDKNDSS